MRDEEDVPSEGRTRVMGEPSGSGMGPDPEFDTDKIVDWTCPNCGENGFDSPKTADYYPLCTTDGCAVKMFTVFRGEPDE